MSNIPNFFVDMLIEQYGQNLTNNVLKGYDRKRPVTIRINTLKSDTNSIKNILNENGILYEDVPFYNDALILKKVKEKEIEELDMYKNGEIYLQSLSSMLPPIVLEPKPNMDILDMCAAPRGKNYRTCITFFK